MQTSLFIRPLTADERHTLAAGLRSAEAFTVRRCQMLLASAEGQHTTTIARALRCHDQTVRNAIHAFHQRGVRALQPKSSRPHRTQAVFDTGRRERLRALLHQSPRLCGKATSVWTLALAAEVSYAQGLTPRQVSGEAIRLALQQLGVRWKRAKHWITSPDPAYLRNKNSATASSGWPLLIRRGRSALPMKSGGAAWLNPPRSVGLRPRPSPGFRNGRVPRAIPTLKPWRVMGWWYAARRSVPSRCSSGLSPGAPSAP